MSSSPPASAVVLDALPYVDVVHEDYEGYALALVEQEMAKISSPAATKSLAPISEHNKSTILQTEYEFVASGKERPSIIGGSDDNITIPLTDDENEWKECIQKARADYEAERLRSAILELEGKHAPDQWKHYTSNILESLEQQETSLYNHQKSLLEEIHAQRQEEQVEAFKTLQQLQQRWHDLIQKRHYLHIAITELEAEVNRMKEE